MGELKYIMENSQAGMLLSTEKFAPKAHELKGALDREVVVDILEKIKVGGRKGGRVEFENGSDTNAGGMMLYTSGTTSRPVRSVLSWSW